PDVRAVHFRHSHGQVIPIRDEDYDQSGLPSPHPDVPREFDEDCRLVVSVRETLTALLQGHPHDILRLALDAFDLASLGDVSVLAIAAVMHHESISNVIVI